VHSRVLQEVPHKGEIQLDDAGGEARMYIKQITTKKGMYIEFYYIFFHIFIIHNLQNLQ
jgi:hypothetical protein